MILDTTIRTPALAQVRVTWSRGDIPVGGRWHAKVHKVRARYHKNDRAWDVWLKVQRMDSGRWCATRLTAGPVGAAATGYGRTRIEAVQAWVVALYEGWDTAGSR